MGEHRGRVHGVRVISLKDGMVSERADLVAEEEPLLIRLGYGPMDAREERDLAVTMRTPGNDAELAAGFILSEGVVTARGDVLSIRTCDRSEAGNVVRVELSAGVVWDASRVARHFYASSSCGICGKASVDAVMTVCGRDRITSGGRVGGEALRKIPRALREAQGVFERTGGLHGAAVFDAVGELRWLREDVGRHNAVDKVLGYRWMSGEGLEDDWLVLSGRISFELVQKAVVSGIGVVIALGAPSGAAVRLAEAFAVTLVGFLREDRWNVYCDGGRVDVGGFCG